MEGVEYFLRVFLLILMVTGVGSRDSVEIISECQDIAQTVLGQWPIQTNDSMMSFSTSE